MKLPGLHSGPGETDFYTMKTLRYVAIATFCAGAMLLAAGVLLTRGSEDSRADEEPFVAVTATPTSAPTETPTNAPTPTATPTPFDGKVTRLKIPRFSVDSAIEEIGLLPSNQLDTPHDPLKTGWYYIYDKPGFLGNAVFSAHVDYYPNIIGPFNKLKNSEIGDDIVVVMENGLEYKYRVIRKERYDVATIPMGDLIWPTNKPAGAEWVTLITCGGEFRSATPGGPGEYLHRDVVVAERYQ